ncbi:aminoglycoside phosphotransferase family protein [Pleurocapsa sp. PCC 7319]|uniref:aminoglycoside phosphotransferase family protein n=1 Tax=Pleurocapsa sp. PCC 7319 TaxID=118161 RepID=UPI0003496A7A|nr:aminoglycoside phosphotransferase family protein [Pleurocapsa sp. PCC 7319]
MDWQLIELIIDRVFPKGAKLIPSGKQVPFESRFWVIGSHKGPRWIIPQNPKYGISVLQQWRPYGTISYWKWQFLLGAYQAKQLQRLPGVTSIGIVGAKDRNWQHLGLKGLYPLPIIYIGTPGINRKAVVSLVDSKSNLIGIAKVPLANNATIKILHEAKTLSSLATEKPGFAPQLLYVDRAKGIAVQTSREGKLTETSLTSAHISWFACACIPDLQTSLQKQVQFLKQRLAMSDSIKPNMQANLTQLLARLEDPTPLPSVWVHGDFAPWNLKWSSGRQLLAVDWEEAKFNGLPLQDLFHFQYIQSHLLQKKKNLLETTRKQPIVAQYLDSVGIDRSRYEKLAQFYLAESWFHCQEREDWDYAAFLAAEISHILRE